MKIFISDEPTNYSDERVLQETREYIQSIQEISPEKRVYMDESFIYDNEAPSMDRSMGGKHISRPRKRHGKRWTFYLAIRSTGICLRPPDIIGECKR
ncbi:hypothetical protein HDU92_004182 [Lobulomyces angularis]|nr:hypothetical protein HDU92_004182 [Lobulomyces angularis]